MEERPEKMFLAHHPDKSFVKKNCNHYFYGNISIAEMRADADHVTEPFQHTHDDYAFLLPYGPLPMIMYEKAVYFGEPGYVYPVQSQKEHASKLRVTGVSHDSIVVRKEYMESLLGRTPYVGREFDARAEVTQELTLYIRLFKSMCRKQQNEKIRSIKLENLTELICIELIETAFNKERVRKKEEVWQYQQGILAVAEYMNEHYREQLDIEKLAKMAGRSKNYFISSFKKFMGETPINYLAKLRVSYAKILLEYSEDTIAQIAVQCGFRRANTFSAIFKKETGMTPSEYKSFLSQEPYRAELSDY